MTYVKLTIEKYNKEDKTLSIGFEITNEQQEKFQQLLFDVLDNISRLNVVIKPKILAVVENDIAVDSTLDIRITGNQQHIQDTIRPYIPTLIELSTRKL